MLDRTELIKIISGHRHGLRASVIRSCLSCLTPIYRLVIGIRNRRFDRAMAIHDQTIVKQAGVPVISVGNLTTGGTGKTPLVIWIANYLQHHALRVALISRGYGSRDTDRTVVQNDEAMEMEIRLPGVPHLQSPDRYGMSQQAIEEFNTQIIVLDDAFQHRHIHRDLDIVLIDATLPFGFGRLLPRGLLREPLSSLRRADLVILTRSDLVDQEQREQTVARIREDLSDQPVLETRTVACGLIQSNGQQTPIEEVSGQSIFYFCGIGNPAGFQASLEGQGFDIRGSAIFPDHHDYSPRDIEQIGESAVASGASAIVCTHKDLVKIGVNQLHQLPLYAIVIDIRFLSGEKTIESTLDELIESARRAAP